MSNNPEAKQAHEDPVPVQDKNADTEGPIETNNPQNQPKDTVGAFPEDIPSPYELAIGNNSTATSDEEEDQLKDEERPEPEQDAAQQPGDSENTKAARADDQHENPEQEWDYDVTNGYPLLLYEVGLLKPSQDAILLHVSGGPVPIKVYAQPETTFGSISDFLSKEFNLFLTFRYQDKELEGDATPFDYRMYREVTLDTIQLIDEDEPVKKLPAQIRLVAVYFVIPSEPPAPISIITPCGASLLATWKRNGLDTLTTSPRFNIDGDRQDQYSCLTSIDLIESVVIDVMRGARGGGGDTDIENAPAEMEEVQGANLVTLETPFDRQAYREPEDPTGSDNSEDPPVPAFVPVPRVQVLAAPKPSGQVPQVFCGKGVEVFFEEYEAYCNDRNYTDKGRFDNLTFFLSREEPHNILNLARNQQEWKNKDYSGIKSKLLRAFAESDVDKFTIADLLEFVKNTRVISTLQELNLYILAYKDIADNLLRHQRVTEVTYKEYFLQGLPAHIIEKLERQDYEQRHRAGNPSIEQIEDDVRRVFQPTGFYSRFRHTHGLEQDRYLHPEHVKTPNMIPASSRSTKGGVSEDVKALTKMMEQVALNMGRFVDNRVTGPTMSTTFAPRKTAPMPSQAPPMQSHVHVAPMGGPIATPYRGDPSRQTNSQSYPAFNPNPPGCHYCGNQMHSKHSCSLFQSHQAQGMVRLDPESNKMLGPDGRALPWRPGHMAEVVQQRATEWQANQGPAATNTHQFQGEEAIMEPHGQHQDFAVHTNLCEYMWEEELASNNVVNHEPLHPTNPFRTEAAEKRRSEERNDGPAKRLRSSAANPDQQHEDEDMEDELGPDEAAAASTTKRQPSNIAIRSHASENWSSSKVFQRVLDTLVEIPIRELIGADKDLERDMTRYCKARKVTKIGPMMAHTNSAAVRDEDEDGPFYTHCLPMIRVTVNGLTCSALIDTGSEIDIMSLDLFSKLGAPLRKDGIHKVVGIGNHVEKLHGVCEGLKLTIGGITNTINVFVRAGLSYSLLIGMPGIRRFNICTRLGRDGQLWVEMKNEEGVKVQIQGTKNTDPRNRQFLPPNWGRTRRAQVNDPDSSSESSN